MRNIGGSSSIVDGKGILVAAGEGVALRAGRSAWAACREWYRARSPCRASAGQRPQQRPGVGVARVVVDLLRGADLDDLPRIHHGHAVRRARHDAEVVRDENRRRAEAFAEVRAEGPESGPEWSRPARSSARRQAESSRSRGQRDGQDGTLAHAAGEVVRIERHAAPSGRSMPTRRHQLQHARSQTPRAEACGSWTRTAARQSARRSVMLGFSAVIGS